ncbi:MAG TPA: AbrB/MazE/SpoVT family DNA-binding domain-containing protein [Candidatus Methylomirabilis sp.]|nr:AbrB/MazE/SpoVT family DNA-binding domain-containing protein [Candidatus Methylomirabilis sp.]
MEEETITMSGKGQIVIPARIRKRFGLKKGEKMILEIENRRISLIPKTVDLTTLVGSWPDLDIDAVERGIIQDRQEDEERERQIEESILKSQKKRKNLKR